MSDFSRIKQIFFNLKSIGNSKLQGRTEKPSSALKIWCMVLQKPPLAKSPIDKKFAQSPWHELNTIDWFLSHYPGIIPWFSHETPPLNALDPHQVFLPQVYDPYYCNGRAKRLLKAFGDVKKSMKSEFGGMNIHKSKLFWCEQKGTRVPWPIDQTWSNMIKVYVSSPVEASYFFRTMFAW